MTKKHLVFRCNAGLHVGMGHLFRCANLATAFDNYSVHFLVQTDIKNQSMNVLQSYHVDWTLHFLAPDMSADDDVKMLADYLMERKAFLILDHYNVDEAYQKYLVNKGVKWLQFDSAAKQKLYADVILHASPGATADLYAPLLFRKNSHVLLGLKYLILNKKFQAAAEKAKIRTALQSIFIGFGAGNDKGLLWNCMQSLDEKLLTFIPITIAIGDNTLYRDEIMTLSKQYPLIEVLVNEYNLSSYLLKSDLMITAPGTMSYEGAALGLPMLLVCTNENQHINLKAWQDMQVAFDITENGGVDSEKMNTYIHHLVHEKALVREMSEKCLTTIDNQGVYRIKNAIESLI
ncbi:MAG: UDP-2,4-diacetamido-2,4,6-trideoxy-beta-L-altropyranose hydrolase [Bacteroidales bacterium]|nr:UDP-2,4-diacetamido-2,4,6-trideoxy-beta-L-altropyranose hydrolase [Bacteroidales bacterium]